MSKTDAVHISTVTKEGTPVAGVLVEIVDDTGQVITDALTNDVGTITLRLPAPPDYFLRFHDDDGIVRETQVARGSHVEHLVSPARAGIQPPKAEGTS